MNQTQSNQSKLNKRKSEIFICEICSIEVGSLDVLECHKKGQKHSKKLRQLAETQSILPTPSEIKSEPLEASSSSSNLTKNSLQLMFEFSTKNKIKLTYEVVSESGPPHNKQFQVKCSLSGQTKNEVLKETSAFGSSINRAKHLAADLMLKEIPSLIEYISTKNNKKASSSNKSVKTITFNKSNITSDVSNITNLNEYEELISINNKRCILAKSAQIQPGEIQLNFINNILILIETNLKKISDKLIEDEISCLESRPENCETYRQLESVVRTDNLVKDTFLKTDRNICLVVIMKSIPTLSIIKKIANEISLLLKNNDSAINFSLIDENECLSVRCESSYNPNDFYFVKIFFTSMLVTLNEEQTTSCSDVISLDICRHALTLVMRIKWFNMKLKPILNSVLIIRLLRDLCHRSPTWSVLNDWLLELLVEKCFFRYKYEEITLKLRSFFELISSGCLFLNDLFIKDNSNNNEIICLIDPCTNKDAFDQILTRQQKEDLTSSAQHALRLISFNRIKDVLAIDLQ